MLWGAPQPHPTAPSPMCPPAVPHWGPWGDWTPCERPLWGAQSCEPAVGQQRRTRECVGRKPGGPACLAEGGVATIQIRACYNIHHCLRE